MRRFKLAIFVDIIKFNETNYLFIKKKNWKKLKELEIMCQNAVYICFSWYSKICWLPVKKVT